MTTPAIELINVSYSYARSKKYALKDLNLRVEQGEFLAVMGENGAGKSTFCQILNGILPNSMGGRLKGKVLVQGLNTVETPISQLATKVAIVLEDPETQFFTSCVRSEIAFGPENLCVPVDEILERIKWSLDVVRLTGFEDRLPTALSGGQKQRLAIAAGIAMRPSILVLDEATSQLDPVGVKEVLSVVKELNEKYGMTIVMATDHSEEVARVASHVVVIDAGKLVDEGTPRQIFANLDLFDKYMIRSPQVSQMGAQMVKAGIKLPVFPLSVEEGCQDLVELLGKKPASKLTLEKSQNNELPAEPTEPVITVDHLDFVYQPMNVHAVQDVNFVIHRGEFVALIGQNGSGKTTVLKNLLGLLKPTSGKVIIAGLDTKEVSVADLARHVGFVLQNPDQQLFAETVREEVSYGPKNLGLDAETIKERVIWALKEVGLEGKEEDFPPALPKGDRAKVVIASALALDPEVIVLDEPTTGQDYRGCHQIMQIADSLHRQGRTVVFVTHHMALVAEYAKRVIVMTGGKVLMDGNTEDVFSKPDVVREAYIIPPQITELGQALPAELGLPCTPLSVKQMVEPILARLDSIHTGLENQAA
ncbi:MAG: energy-coupling factor transporter ATPase [Anaerolineaceae bacterium]|jgi:energy-coupling factor transport system ATP-binding protein